jgi:DNA-binding transcriptional ArsR family regulator
VTSSPAPSPSWEQDAGTGSATVGGVEDQEEPVSVQRELDELRRRVALVEQRLDPAPAPPPAAPGELTGDPFWLLDELRARGLDPAVAFGGTAVDADGAPVAWQITRSADDLSTTDWAASVPVLAALGHPSRMQILQLVATGRARTAAELAHTEGLGTTGQIYHHLRQLVAGGWLRVTTRGQHQVPAERLVPLLVVLAATGG